MSDFQNVTRVERETKSLVDLSVLFKFEKTKYAHIHASIKKQRNIHMYFICVLN